MSYQGAVFSINCSERGCTALFLHLPSVSSSSLGLFHTMTLFSGSSQVAISCEAGCSDCSCSAGLCLVSLTLSKADHTIPSTPPAGQEHNPFTMHLPYRLSSYSNLYFPGSTSSHVTTFLLLRLCCVIVDAFSSETK